MADVRLLLKQATAARSQQADNSGTARKRKAPTAASHTVPSKKPRPMSLDTTTDHEQPFDSLATVTVPADVPKSGDEDNDAAHAAELAALDRELSMMAAQHVIHAAPAVSAPPMAAEEIAAQARVEHSTQRSSRDAEQEAEREDSERATLEELETMDGLEERLQKLRQRREALKSTTNPLVATTQPHIDPERSSNTEAADGEDGDDDDDDDDDDSDDFAGWHFGNGSTTMTS